MMPHRPQAKIAYLMKSFPKISETFILREILALEEAGMDLQVYSLQLPQEKKSHVAASQVRANVQYIPSSFFDNPIGFLRANFLLVLANPLRYFRALHFLVQRPEAGRFEDFVQACHLALTIRALGLRHLHAHFINKPAAVAELVHLLIGLPYSITAHAKDIYLSPPEELTRKMQRAKFVVTCNDYNREFVENLSTNGTPVFRIYHGLDAAQFCPEPRAEPVEERPMLLSVGRLREKKGFPCLLDACRFLKIGGHRFRCVIVGYGPLKEDIERRIAELGLGDVVSLTGMLTQDEVIDLYKRATIFVLPCQVTENGDRDGIPNVLAEAMVMKLPVVSTSVSGIPELVEHMQNGILVRPEDPAGLAAAIARLLDQPRLREELGKVGRERVCRQFSAQDNAAQLKALFMGPSVAVSEGMQAEDRIPKKNAEFRAA
jgi:glycosyltransferase involved in cell wall biosynthesis